MRIKHLYTHLLPFNRRHISWFLWQPLRLLLPLTALQSVFNCILNAYGSLKRSPVLRYWHNDKWSPSQHWAHRWKEFVSRGLHEFNEGVLRWWCGAVCSCRLDQPLEGVPPPLPGGWSPPFRSIWLISFSHMSLLCSLSQMSDSCIIYYHMLKCWDVIGNQSGSCLPRLLVSLQFLSCLILLITSEWYLPSLSSELWFQTLCLHHSLTPLCPSDTTRYRHERRASWNSDAFIWS